jgi:hypothetical protein
MTLEQEIGGLKKIIVKLLGRVHYRAADLYSTLKRLKSCSIKGKSKNKSDRVDSC